MTTRYGRSPKGSRRASEVRESAGIEDPGDLVAATDAKNQFGRLLDRALSGRRVVITKHQTPAAVLLSFEDYRRLAPDAAPDLGALAREFDDLLEGMQSAPARRAVKALFEASPAALGRAAVAEARRKVRRRKRG
jgi:prevent-host-death family protein